LAASAQGQEEYEGPQAEAACESTNESTMNRAQASEAWEAAKPAITTLAQTDGDEVIRLSIDELTKLAPRLRPYLTSPRRAWP
jgi:hypothetical protein